MGVKVLLYIWAIFLCFAPLLIALGIAFFIWKISLLYELSKSKTLSVIGLVLGIGCTISIWNSKAGSTLLLVARNTENNFIVPQEVTLDGGSKKEIDNLKEETLDITSQNNVQILDYSDTFTASITELYNDVDDGTFYDLSSIGENIIAKDIEDNKEYSVSQLSDTKLFIPYTEDNKDVLFYGQYNEFNHWDGNCIFNIYQEHMLDTVLQADYDDGKLISYKKLFRSVTAQGVDVWSFFNGEMVYEENKDNEDKYTHGEMWNYYKVNEYAQKFELSDATERDLIYVDEFEEMLKGFSGIEGLYYGNISNGYYNDDTGEAYIVKYLENGIVRTVYKGMFKNGLPDDQSGDAWQIVLDKSNNKYFYFKGSFKENVRQGNVSAKNYVTQYEIEKIIEGMSFNCELHWYDESQDKDNEKI